MHVLLLFNRSLSLYEAHPLHVELLDNLFILQFLVLFVPEELGFNLLHNLLPDKLRFLGLV